METEDALVLLVGGPLPAKGGAPPATPDGDEVTQWVQRRWASGDLLWEEDLIGQFLAVRIDKVAATVSIATDVNAFVPAYTARTAAGEFVLGSHADAVARAARRRHDIDDASVADLLLFGAVTHPHTLYEGVRQLPPSAETTLDARGAVTTAPYWDWAEAEPPTSIEAGAEALRSIVRDNVARMCLGRDRVALLLSGGEDSRVVASMVPAGTHVEAITLVDSYNREAQVAERTAARLGLDWRQITRAPDHYVEHAAQSVRLAESHHVMIHSHLSGLSRELPQDLPLLGGLMADTLFKCGLASTGSRFGMETSVSAGEVKTPYGRQATVPLGSTAARDAIDRRRNWLDQLRRLRPKTWAEFANIHPASMWPGMAQIPTARRVALAYEPFLDARAVRLGASIPQEWKLNRRLYHRAMKPYLAQTRSLPHARHFYPYLGPRGNAPFMAAWAAARRVGGLPAAGRLRRTADKRRPWPQWDRVTSSEAFRRALSAAAANGGREALASSSSVAGLLQTVEASPETQGWQRMVVLQLYLWLGSLES